jgi:cytochrome c-type biogenesis protein CcmF
MGIGPLARWKQAELPDLARRLRWALGVAVLAALFTGWLAGGIHLVASLGLFMSFWIVASITTDLWERIGPHGADWRQALQRLRQIPRAHAGMLLAHLGVAVFCFGVVMVKAYEIERDVRMNMGDSTTLSGYTFTLRGLRNITGPNYEAVQGLVTVTRDGRPVASMHPEKRVYRVQQNPMTEAAINMGLTRDLYVSLGEAVDGNAWIVRVYVKPFIDWIWGGCLLMALGGMLAASDRRYRTKRRQPLQTPAMQDGGTGT